MKEEKFWQKKPEDLLKQFDSKREGLTAEEAATRLEKYGENRLREAKKKSVPRIFLEQFADLLVIILIIAAIISMMSGNVESTIVIFVVLLINAALGTVQTVKAENPWRR